MINELVEAKKYLRGEGLNREIEYRICLILAKWFYQEGATTRESLRGQLKTWAKENNFFITMAMNPLCDRVIRDDMKLLGQEPVRINDADADDIAYCFDTYEERIVALAVLSYAKIYSDSDGCFKLSIAALADWLCMERKTVSKYLKTLEGLNFIRQQDTGTTNSWYQKVVVTGCNTYQLGFETINTGEFTMDDNDIDKLYDLIFVNGEWHDIPGFNNWYMISDDGQVRVKKRFSNERLFASKILWPTVIPSGRKYVKLRTDDGKQQTCSIKNLYEMALAK